MQSLPQGRIQDFWKGGRGSRRGYRIFHKHPPLDIVRVTSSALRKKTPPLLGIYKHPPLDIARVTSSTFQGGGGQWRS